MSNIKNPKVTIVTVTFNSGKTIHDTLVSVNDQSYTNIEHIIIDGKSTDSTMEIVTKFQNKDLKIFSEQDNGIYDAMNKGVQRSSGGIIAFLNSDDVYTNDSVISRIVDKFNETNSDIIYGNIVFLNADKRVSRIWKAPRKIDKLTGEQIPHPALFVRAKALKMLNPPFDPTYKIAADLKQQLLLINIMGYRSVYLNEVVAHVALGGTSTRSYKSYLRGWRESVRAYDEVHGTGGVWYTFKKILSKLQWIR